jgi:NAD-dependent dihydropyrimidine dehydrogenase PreA subunit
MPEPRITVVVSQGQSRAPEKRQLELDVAHAAAALPGVEVLLVPHLYDLARDGETYQRLRTIEGDLVLLAWLYDRAAHWILDRHGVRGQVGEVLLKTASEEDDEETPDPAAATDAADLATGPEHVTDLYPRPNRSIYSIDFRTANDSQAFVTEIARIAQALTNPAQANPTAANPAEATFAPPIHSAGVSAEQLARLANPGNDTFVGTPHLAGLAPRVHLNSSPDAASLAPTPPPHSPPQPTLMGAAGVRKVEEHPTRRWYPVIDFSRCTNCMECIDFCLFGVYGIDSVETILVEQPDNCRKGCPACSRVCPQNAIIFPQHKTPAIAGAPVDSGGLKIDLSKLFGAPEEGADAIEVAARERDEQLILAGRAAVGITESLAERLAASADKPRDELDQLLDQLEALDL